MTPRRWLHQANPDLSALIKTTLKSQKFLKDLSLLSGLKASASDPAFQKKWMDIKLQNKKRLADYIASVCGIYVNPESLFDVQVIESTLSLKLYL